MKMHKVKVPIAGLNRCTEKRENNNQSEPTSGEMVIKRAVLHYTNPFARDFLEIRQLYFISMNYGRWI